MLNNEGLYLSQNLYTPLLLWKLQIISGNEGRHEFLQKMGEWARKKIIITTPNGYLWQDGYANNPLQEHKSGWDSVELKELGFKIYGMSGWRKLREYKGSTKYKPACILRPYALFAIAITCNPRPIALKGNITTSLTSSYRGNSQGKYLMTKEFTFG